MRVLHIVESAATGVGRHVVDLAGGQADRGHVVDVLHSSTHVDDAFTRGIAQAGVRRVVAVDLAHGVSLSDWSSIRRVRDYIDTHGPFDVVHGHASKGGLLARCAARGRAPAVYTPNAFKTQAADLSSASRLVYRSAERLLARITSGLICVSPEEKSHADQQGYRVKKSIVVPNGIRSVALPSRSEARAELGLPAGQPVVGFVGRIAAQKGLDLLIRSLPVVLARLGSLTVAVVGDGPLQAEMVALADQLGVSSAISWLGRRDGQRAMCAFDVFALPSTYEGFPYVVLEALYAQVPVVATTACNVTSLLAETGAGYAVERAPALFADALLDALDPTCRPALAAGCAIAAQRHLVDRMVDDTLAFYERVCDAQPVTSIP